MRTFYDVGDALFTVEEVSGNFFVYDCGANTKELAEDTIKRAFPSEKQEIMAVFISHYDRDHINGIHFLLNYCKVNLLVLPLIPNYSKFYVSYQDNFLDESDREFILNTDDYVLRISPDTKIIHISSSNESEQLRNDSISIEELNESEYPSGTQIRFHGKNNIDWVFIPWNIKIMNNEQMIYFYKRFEELFKKHSIDNGDLKGLWEKVNLCNIPGNNGGNKLKKSVEKFIKELRGFDINSISQTLYSGPLVAQNGEKKGCLYLGDYNAKKFFDELSSAYKYVWGSIGIVQIPHHGSPDNFNEKLVSKNTLSVVSLMYPPADKNVKRCKTLIDILINKGKLRVTGICKDIRIS